MNDETLTETPPSAPPAGDLPVFSPRPVWPKPKQEIEIAKTLIKKAYDLAHTVEHNILWSQIKTEHAELFDQLMYFAGDKMQRVYQYANYMRKQHELPSNPDAVPQPRKNTNEKFVTIDTLIRDHRASFPKNRKGVIWSEVFKQHPEIETEAKELWGTDYVIMRYGLKHRLDNIVAKSSDSQVDSAEDDTHAAALTLLRRAAKLCINGDGKISVRSLQRDHPDLWEQLAKIYPKNTYKKVGQKLYYLQKTGKFAGASSRAVAHRSAPKPETLHEHIATIDVASKVENLNQFLLQNCPRCFAHLRTLELLGFDVSACPKCQYPIQKANEGIIARLQIPDQH